MKGWLTVLAKIKQPANITYFWLVIIVVVAFAAGHWWAKR